MDINIDEEYRELGRSYAEARHHLDLPDDVLAAVRTEVSGWSPAQQLFHIALSNGSMLRAIELICVGRGPITTEGEPTPIGRQILASGRFPRGRAQAPDRVQPPEQPTRYDIRAALDRSFRRYEDTAALLPTLPDQTGRLPHPYFGPLTATQWLRVVRIHAFHHLAILDDILAAEVP